MTSALVGVAFLVFVALAVFFIAAYLVNQRRRRDESWQLVASERDLQFFAGSWTTGPSMKGNINGFFVSVDTQRGGGDENHVTRYTIGYPSSVREIELSKQTAMHFTLVKRLMGKNDVEIGDREFDDKVLIDAADPIAATRYLSPARRDAVLRLFGTRTFRNPMVTNTSLLVETSGIESSPVNLRRTILALLEIAETMSAPTDVDLAAAVEEVGPEEPVVQDANVDVEDTEVEDTVVEQDAVVEETATVEDTATVAVAPTRLDPSIALDHDSVINDLFESGRMGFETDAHFAETYAGARIRWTGMVDTIRVFRSDPDFDGSGVKATLLIGDVEQAVSRSRLAKAVVQFPAGTSLARRHSLEFEGTLVRADRFTRRVFIADGTVTS